MKAGFLEILSEKKYSLMAFFIGACAGIYALCWYYYTLKVWNGVPPLYMEDTLFYFARIKEVVDGHLFFSNPFYFEHRNGVAPSFAIAEWFAAVPLAVTHSWTFTIIFNTILWNGLCTFLTFKFFKIWRFSNLFSLSGTAIVFSQWYLHLQRPVNIQISAIFFLILILSFSQWFISVEAQDKIYEKSTILLGIVVALCMYVYVFTGQIGFALLLVILLWAAIMKKKIILKKTLLAGFVSLSLLSPLIIFLYKVSLNKFYADSIGMIYSHMPVSFAVNFSRILFVGLSLIVLGWFLMKKKEDFQDRKFFLMITFLIVSMIIVSFSNIITGKYLEFGQHVAYFSFSVIAILLVASVKVVIQHWQELSKNKIGLSAVLFLIIVITIFLVRNTYLRNQLRFFDPVAARHAQSYAAPLKFIDDYAQTESVVLVSDDMTSFVPVMSKHYSLYVELAHLYELPPYEQAERRYLSQLYSELLKNKVTLSPELQNEFGLLLNKFHVRFLITENLSNVAEKNLEQKLILHEIYNKDGYIIFER